MITKDILPPFDKPKLSKVRSQSEMIRCLYSCARVSDHLLFFNTEVHVVLKMKWTLSGSECGEQQHPPPFS